MAIKIPSKNIYEISDNKVLYDNDIRICNVNGSNISYNFENVASNSINIYDSEKYEASKEYKPSIDIDPNNPSAFIDYLNKINGTKDIYYDRQIQRSKTGTSSPTESLLYIGFNLEILNSGRHNIENIIKYTDQTDAETYAYKEIDLKDNMSLIANKYDGMHLNGDKFKESGQQSLEENVSPDGVKYIITAVDGYKSTDADFPSGGYAFKNIPSSPVIGGTFDSTGKITSSIFASASKDKYIGDTSLTYSLMYFFPSDDVTSTVESNGLTVLSGQAVKVKNGVWSVGGYGNPDKGTSVHWETDMPLIYTLIGIQKAPGNFLDYESTDKKIKLYIRTVFRITSLTSIDSLDMFLVSHSFNISTNNLKASEQITQAKDYSVSDDDIADGRILPYEFEASELIQDTIFRGTATSGKPIAQYISENIVDDWRDGKETASIKVSMNKYYDINGNLAINPDGVGGETDKTPMTFSIDDEVIPYIRDGSGNDVPMSYYASDSPKVFIVKNIEYLFDGACWQILHLQEKPLKAGLYETGKETLKMSWNDMIRNNYISVSSSGALSYGSDRTGLQALSGDLIVSNDVTRIGFGAFKGCTGLTNIMLDNVEIIWPNAFENCTSLSSITIPASVTNIGDYAFSKSALTSIIIPDSVTSMGQYVFSDCTGLTTITPNKMMVESNYRVNASLFSTYFAGANNITTVIIPDGVTKLGNGAFNNCTNLSSITIPDSVKSISYRAFYGCSGLTSINLSDNVTSVEGYAFNNSGLTKISIGMGITGIDYWAFSNCSNLSSVTIKAIEPPLLGSNIFYNCSKLTAVYVPAKSVSAYKNAEGWSDYVDLIKPI